MSAVESSVSASPSGLSSSPSSPMASSSRSKRRARSLVYARSSGGRGPPLEGKETRPCRAGAWYVSRTRTRMPDLGDADHPGDVAVAPVEQLDQAQRRAGGEEAQGLPAPVLHPHRVPLRLEQHLVPRGHAGQDGRLGRAAQLEDARLARLLHQQAGVELGAGLLSLGAGLDQQREAPDLLLGDGVVGVTGEGLVVGVSRLGCSAPARRRPSPSGSRPHPLPGRGR